METREMLSRSSAASVRDDGKFFCPGSHAPAWEHTLDAPGVPYLAYLRPKLKPPNHKTPQSNLRHLHNFEHWNIANAQPYQHSHDLPDYHEYTPTFA
jgi:hypothetical protein